MNTFQAWLMSIVASSLIVDAITGRYFGKRIGIWIRRFWEGDGGGGGGGWEPPPDLPPDRPDGIVADWDQWETEIGEPSPISESPERAVSGPQSHDHPSVRGWTPRNTPAATDGPI